MRGWRLVAAASFVVSCGARSTLLDEDQGGASASGGGGDAPTGGSPTTGGGGTGGEGGEPIPPGCVPVACHATKTLVAPTEGVYWSLDTGGTWCGRVTLAANAGGARLGGVDVGDDIFVAQFDGSTGGVRWVRPFMPGDGGPYRVAVEDDPFGDVVVAGRLTTYLSIDGFSATSSGTDDIFLFKLDEHGHARWLRTFAGGGHERATAIATGADGTIYIAGRMTRGLDLGGGVLQGGTFVAAFDRDGNHLWSQGIKGGGDEGPTMLVATADGGVLAAGQFFGTFHVPGGEPYEGFAGDMFIARFGRSGEPVFGRAYGGPWKDFPLGLAETPSGIAFLGAFQGLVDFGDGPIELGYGLWTHGIVRVDLDASGRHVKTSVVEGSQEGYRPLSAALGPAVSTITTMDGYIRVDVEGNVLAESPLEAHPKLGRVPDGAAMVGLAYEPIEIDGVAIPAGASYVAPICDAPLD